jgi:hypothetical protein
MLMASFNYEVIGAGSTSDNPIKVVLHCQTATTICWIGRTSCTGGCEVAYDDDTYCDSVAVGSGHVTWHDKNVYYNVTNDCPTPVQPTCTTYTCSDLNAYPVPLYVSEDYDGYIDIEYDYYLTCINGDYVGDRYKKSGIKTVALSSFTWDGEKYKYNFSTGDGCSKQIIVYKTTNDDCTQMDRTDVSFSVNPSVVNSTGSDVYITVSFKRTVVDENCKKNITSGSFIIKKTVDQCQPTQSDQYWCCKEHYVNLYINVNEITRVVGRDTEVWYNGSKVTTRITYQIVQKPKTGGECENYCEEKITYCVKSSTVKVYYETRYMSNEWSATGVVPFEGGRLKVKWDYVSTKTLNNCTTVTGTGTWEEIVTVGGCDEHPSGCDDDCCYNVDNNGTNRCTILFKEQTPGCSTCPSEMFDGVNFNKITYTYKQDCEDECSPSMYTKYDKQTVHVSACFTGTTAITVPYTSTTEYNGYGCPSTKTETGTTTVTVNVTTPNDSMSFRTVYTSEMATVIQGEVGLDSDKTTCLDCPCNSQSECGCASIEFDDAPCSISVTQESINCTGGTIQFTINK